MGETEPKGHTLPRRWYKHAPMGKLTGRSAYIYEQSHKRYERRGNPCLNVLPGEIGIVQGFRFIRTDYSDWGYAISIKTSSGGE